MSDRSPAPEWWWGGPLLLLLGVAILPIAGYFIGGSDDLPRESAAVATTTPTSSSTFAAPPTAPAPTTLRIPALSLSAPFEAPLGLRADGQVEVPERFDTVGWYEPSPAPGALGPAVVLGHVDSYRGPAVFYSLGQLSPGDAVYVDRADGSTATFTVTHLEWYRQDGFPTEKVYGDLDYAGLRLITCSGEYDRETGRYSHNLIVFARLAE